MCLILWHGSCFRMSVCCYCNFESSKFRLVGYLFSSSLLRLLRNNAIEAINVEVGVAIGMGF